MKTSIIFFLAAIIAICSAATCSPSIVTTQRPGTFQVSGGTGAIFDIVITNAGTCPITEIIINAVLPAGTTLRESWNLVNIGGTQWRVTSFEPQLPPGNTVNAGLIIVYPTTNGANLPPPTITLQRATCPVSCAGTAAPTTPATVAPTNAPTNAPTTPATVAPTNAPTNAPTSPPTNATCRPTIVATQRPDTFQVSGGTGAIFDIVITNAGTCPITEIIIRVVLPSGATLRESWNLVSLGNNLWRVTSFEPQLPVGNSVNAGVIVVFPTTVQAPSITLSSVTCPPSCAGTAAPTTAPTTPATVAPTNAPTRGPTNAPTTPATVAPTNAPCNIAISIRIGSTWTTNGVRYATYYIFITNNGGCPLIDINISINLGGGEIVNSWNLGSSGSGYAIQGYGGSLRPGDSYGGSGFNARLSGEISVSISTTNCRC